MTGNQTDFLLSLGWAVLNSLWQLALLWVIYRIATGLFKKATPSAKSLLATSLLVIGFAWFIYTFFLAYTSGHEKGGAVFSAGIINERVGPGVNDWAQQVLPYASVIYLLLLGVRLLHFTRNYRYAQVIRKYGLSKIGVEWKIFVNRLSARMGIKKTVRIWVSEWVHSPVTVGFLKPVILVPMAAVNHLSPQQMEAVLLHELAHIRRFDYLLNLIINFIQSILYFNPFARAFVQIVEKEREKSCDETVLQFQYDSHEYASALLTLEKESRNTRLLILPAGGKGRDLLHRIETIMGLRREQSFSFRRAAAVVAVFFFVITFNTLFLLNKPFEAERSMAKGITPSSPLLNETAAPFNASSVAERPVSIYNGAIKPASLKTKYIHPATALASAIGSHPGFINANFEQAAEPRLTIPEEAQVKKTIESSRKVMENAQWKEMEKNLADVFTEKEKETLKTAMQKELNKFDWDQWEEKLKLAYDKVDWDRVNYQLTNAINQIRVDSLVKVYNEALVQLDQAKKELVTVSTQIHVPQSDFNLRLVGEQQKQLQNALNKLKATRNKKIVHL